MNMCKFSFLIPVYNSDKTIGAVVDSIISSVNGMEKDSKFEIVLVDDGSSESTKEACKVVVQAHPEVTVFRLSRNFGQANALMAGLNHVRGDYVVCLDDDLQTSPEEFPKLYAKLINGDYDIVYGYYSRKRHNFFRNIGTKVNELMQSVVLGKPKDIKTSSYFIAKKAVVDVVKEYDKPFPYLPGLFLRATAKVGSEAIRHHARKEGKSGYSFGKLLNLWLDGFTNFSIRPLRFSTFLGFIVAAAAFILILVVLIDRILNPNVHEGWPSIFAAVLFMGGVQMICVGLLGEYVGRVYLSVNKTPQYVIRDKLTAGDIETKKVSDGDENKCP